MQVSFALYQEREEATGVSPGLGALAKFEWLVSRGREVFRIRNRGGSTSSREREWTSYSIARCIARTHELAHAHKPTYLLPRQDHNWPVTNLSEHRRGGPGY